MKMNFNRFACIVVLYSYVGAINLQNITGNDDTVPKLSLVEILEQLFRNFSQSIETTENIFGRVINLSKEKTTSFNDAIAVLNQIANFSQTFFGQMVDISFTKINLEIFNQTTLDKSK